MVQPSLRAFSRRREQPSGFIVPRARVEMGRSAAATETRLGYLNVSSGRGKGHERTCLLGSRFSPSIVDHSRWHHTHCNLPVGHSSPVQMDIIKVFRSISVASLGAGWWIIITPSSRVTIPLPDREKITTAAPKRRRLRNCVSRERTPRETRNLETMLLGMDGKAASALYLGVG